MNPDESIIQDLMKVTEHWESFLKKVGLVSVEFAKIESELLALLALFSERRGCPVCSSKVGNLQYSPALDELDALFKSAPFPSNTDIPALICRLRKAGHDRNRIMHSVVSIIPSRDGAATLEAARDKFKKHDRPVPFEELDTMHSSLSQAFADLRTLRMEQLYKGTEQENA